MTKSLPQNLKKLSNGMLETPFFEMKHEWIAENNLAFAVISNPEVSKGHTLILTKRLILTPFEMTDEEELAVKHLRDEQKKLLDKKYSPDGYNIFWNVMKAGGQSVAHVHLHILPRYNDDVLRPKGGCLNLFPDLQNRYKYFEGI